MMCRTIVLLQLFLTAAFGAHGPQDVGPPIHFYMEVYRTECSTGTPILVRLTIKNPGPADYKMVGGLGWGRGFWIACADERGSQIPVYPDVTQFEGIYSPRYYFTGTIPAEESQSIVHMVKTARMKAGELNLMALAGLREETLRTPGLAVSLVDSPKDEEGRESPALSADEQSFIYDYVPRRHNRFDRGRTDTPRLGQYRARVFRIVRNAMASDESSLACELALYAGVLQSLHVVATAEDIKLAEQAAEALEKRFPNSWLRAYAYGMLATVHFERGNLEKARGFAEKGLKLPESNPLFHNLSIMEKLEKLKASSAHEHKK